MELLLDNKIYDLKELLDSFGLGESMKSDSLDITTEIIKDGQTIRGLSRFKSVEISEPWKMIESLMESSLTFYQRLEEGQLKILLNISGEESLKLVLMFSLDDRGHILVTKS